MEPATKEDLLDLLLDLKHDLGKYIVLPVSMLPADAGTEQVHQALEMALMRTRVGPRGVRSAGQIWKEFVADEQGRLAHLVGRPALTGAVENALALERVLRPGSQPPVRLLLRRKLAAVSVAIADLIEELNNEE